MGVTDGDEAVRRESAGIVGTGAAAERDDAATSAARDAAHEAALAGLCREGREAIAADVLRRHGVRDPEVEAARIVAADRDV